MNIHARVISSWLASGKRRCCGGRVRLLGRRVRRSGTARDEWRSMRATGDTKTRKPRRILVLPKRYSYRQATRHGQRPRVPQGGVRRRTRPDEWTQLVTHPYITGHIRKPDMACDLGRGGEI
jgi:hypothetical protein